jgi:hypothetical protein
MVALAALLLSVWVVVGKSLAAVASPETYREYREISVPCHLVFFYQD